jgi:2-amino-4-hydroxy-6-hydroxymethyldihydropteridine diphosphokinase
LRKTVCYVGIGSNLGDTLSNCRDAAGRIETKSGIELLKKSALYKSEPIGNRDQDWFLNGVVEFRTALTPHILLQVFQEIEEAMGRTRTNVRWAPRVIDIDILFYGQEIIDDETLIIPHPELHKRRFVLVPLCEIAASFIHPLYCVSVKGLLERLDDGMLFRTDAIW